MAYYDTDYLPQNAILQYSRQFKLTIRTTYKLLETGIYEFEDGFKLFIIRLIKNAVDEDDNPDISYIDLCIEDFDCIVEKAQLIKYLLKNNLHKTVYQNENVHVWVKRSQTPLLCIRDSRNGTRINMIERTFDRLINRVDWVEYEYNRLIDDEDDESYDTDDSDGSYDYSDDSEYSDDD